jgi:hypothetical protein
MGVRLDAPNGGPRQSISYRIDGSADWRCPSPLLQLRWVWRSVSSVLGQPVPLGTRCWDVSSPRWMLQYTTTAGASPGWIAFSQDPVAPGLLYMGRDGGGANAPAFLSSRGLGGFDDAWGGGERGGLRSSSHATGKPIAEEVFLGTDRERLNPARLDRL